MKLTLNDAKLIDDYDSYELGETGRDATEMQLKVADTDGNEEVDLGDSINVECIVMGTDSYSCILRNWN